MLHTEPSTALATRVRDLTKEDHKSAETVAFITELMSGKRCARDYALLVSQYHFIYTALDESSELLRKNTQLTGVVDLLDPDLDRRSAIRKDLTELLPAAGLSDMPIQLRTTANYARRLRAVAHDPARLTAHHYLRYLGDLSGGLAIARLVQRHYHIPDEQLNMYNFDSIGKSKLYKDAYREKLNNLGLSLEQEDAFVDEAALGFRYNKAIFEDLGEYSDTFFPLSA